MHFEPNARARDAQLRVRAFIDEHVRPAEREHFAELRAANHGGDWRAWQVSARIEALKALAREQGLWNLFLPDERLGAGLSTVEYAPAAEEMGRSLIAPEV